MHRSGNVAVDELQTVGSAGGRGLVGEAEAVKCAVKPVAGSIPGKDPSCAISAMRRRCEAHNKKSSIARPQAGNRAAPIVPIAKPPDLVGCDLLAVKGQTFASPAIDDFILSLAFHPESYFSLRARSIRKNISVLSMVPLKRLEPGPRAPMGTSTAEWPAAPPPALGVKVVVGFKSRRLRGRS